MHEALDAAQITVNGLGAEVVGLPHQRLFGESLK